MKSRQNSICEKLLIHPETTADVLIAISSQGGVGVCGVRVGVGVSGQQQLKGKRWRGVSVVRLQARAATAAAGRA